MNMNGRIATSLVMVGIFTFFVGQAVFFRYEAAVMPLLVGLPGLALSLAQLFVEVRATGTRSEDEPIVSGAEATIILWLTGFTLCITAFGFVLGAPLLLAAYLFFVAAERPAVAIAGGALCFAAMYGLERLLNIPLFEGLVMHYLF